MLNEDSCKTLYYTCCMIFMYRYVDDIPSFDGELFAGFVLSTCAHATFTLDISSIKDMKVDTVHSCIKCVLK